MRYKSFVLLIIGHSMSGKTTMTNRLRDSGLFSSVVDDDVLRNEHYGGNFSEMCKVDGEYSLEKDIEVSAPFFWTIPYYLQEYLKNGSVALSSTMSASKKDGLVTWLSSPQGANIEYCIIRLTANLDEERVLERIEERSGRNDQSPHASFEAFQKSQSFQTDWPEDFKINEVDTTNQTPEETCQAILDIIKPFEV